jgi:hypothetical protein
VRPGRSKQPDEWIACLCNPESGRQEVPARASLRALGWHNAGMHSRPLRPGRLVGLCLLAALATACGSSSATPTLWPSPTAPSTPAPTATSIPTAQPTPYASADMATYAQIETEVQQIRQLTAKKAVTPTLLDEQGVRDWMTQANEKTLDHAALTFESRLFVDLGLLPLGSSLEQLELDLNSGQAIGFYDPSSGGLYLLSEGGTVGPQQKLTFSHEFTHALQDQDFGLDKLAIDTPDQGDRDLARTALPEGDASLAMTQWARAHMSLTDLLAISLDPGAQAQQQQLDAAPAILREDLYFPYVQGLAFVEAVYVGGGWPSVNKLYANPPNSTSQILHPDLYSKGVQPVAVTLPAIPATLGSGWKLSFQDTLGELQLRVWLEGEHPTAAQSSAAASAVSAWGGDRAGLYDGPNDTWAVVLKTEWRSASGAVAFGAAAGTPARWPAGPSKTCASGAGVTVYVASDAATLASFASC